MTMSDTTTTEAAVTNPVAAGKFLFTDLLAWQPALAAALAMHVRALPDDWTLRYLGIGRTEAALQLTSGASFRGITDHAPEVAPWQADMDECDACAEAEGTCRYHQGLSAGHDPMFQMMLQAVKDDPAVTVSALLDRYIAEREAAAA
jgi:hypothetical protein